MRFDFGRHTIVHFGVFVYLLLQSLSDGLFTSSPRDELSLTACQFSSKFSKYTKSSSPTLWTEELLFLSRLEISPVWTGFNFAVLTKRSSCLEKNHEVQWAEKNLFDLHVLSWVGCDIWTFCHNLEYHQVEIRSYSVWTSNIYSSMHVQTRYEP